jgi:hypothetical protein
MPDGSTAFEPIEDGDREAAVGPMTADREIVL